MVAAFEKWCFDGHKTGDTGIVESEYGYHVMFYSGDSETIYRDYLISTDLASADYEVWCNEIVSSVTATEHSFKYVRTDLVLTAA